MENKIKYPAKLSSNNQSEYGIIDAIEISGHKSVNNLAALYSISDCILSKSKINTDDDAIGQQWYVISEHKYYQLDSWNNRNNINGWSIASISVYMKYIGSVTDYTDLPSNLTIDNSGYVYNIINSFTIESGAFEGIYPAGTDVAWTGDSWNPLGGNSYVLTTSDAYDRVVLTNTTEGQDVKINLNLKNGTGYKSLCGTNKYANSDNSIPVASGYDSIAFGEFSKAIASTHCFAIGRSCEASGNYSYAIGDSTTTRGRGGFCGGDFSSSNGNYSFCYSSFASYTKGEGDVSFGSMNTTSKTEGLGNFSAAIGIYNITNNYGEVALGIGNISLYNATDMSKCTAFTVGGAIVKNKGFSLDTYTGNDNGRSHNANCCNLLDVRRNGDVYIKSNTTDITAYHYDPQYDDSTIPFSSLPKLESANLILQQAIQQNVDYAVSYPYYDINEEGKIYLVTSEKALYTLTNNVITLIEPCVPNRLYAINSIGQIWKYTNSMALIKYSNKISSNDEYNRILINNGTVGEQLLKLDLNAKNGVGSGSIILNCGSLATGSANGVYSLSACEGIASGANSIALGWYSSALGKGSVALGYNSSRATGDLSVAIGNCSNSTGDLDITIGRWNVSSSDILEVLSTNNGSKYGCAIGNFLKTTNNGESAIGICNNSIKSDDFSIRTQFSIGGGIVKTDEYNNYNDNVSSVGDNDLIRLNIFDIKRNGDVYIKSNTTDIIQDTVASTEYAALKDSVSSANLCLQESINQTVYSKVDSISLILSTDKLYILTTDNKLYKLVDSVATVVEPIVKNRIYICELDQSEWRWDGTSWHQLNASQSSSSGITDDNTLEGVGSQSDPYAIKPSADTLSANDPLRTMVTKFNTSTNQKEISWIKPSYSGWTNFDMLFIKYFGNLANNNSASDGNKKYVAFAFSPNETTIFKNVRIMISQQFGSGSLYIGIYEKNGSNNPLIATAEFSSSNGNLTAGFKTSEFDNKVLLTPDKLYYIMFLDAANGGTVGMNQFDYPQISNAAFEMGYGAITNVSYSTLPSTLPTNYPFPSSSTSQTKLIPYMKFSTL